jgi:hypothetical protein
MCVPVHTHTLSSQSSLTQAKRHKDVYFRNNCTCNTFQSGLGCLGNGTHRTHLDEGYPMISTASVGSQLNFHLSASFGKVINWTLNTLVKITNCYFLLNTHSAFATFSKSFEVNKWYICWKGKWMVPRNDTVAVNIPQNSNIKWGFLFSWEALWFCSYCEWTLSSFLQ